MERCGREGGAGEGGCRSTGAPFLLDVQCCAAGSLLGKERAVVCARLAGSNQGLPDKRHVQITTT